MVELVRKPYVTVVAQTEFKTSQVMNFFGDFGYPYKEEGTPANRLSQRARPTPAEDLVEFAGRFCYRSFSKGRPSAEYIENVLQERHGSVLEHSTVTLAIAGVSRSLTHELVRHRTGIAVSQESQRYVEAKDIRFVVPPIFDLLEAKGEDISQMLQQFHDDCEFTKDQYASLTTTLKDKMDQSGTTIQKKRALEAARALLPNAAETRLVWTMNGRSLRHICELRGSPHADLEIRRLFVGVTEIMMQQWPNLMADFETYRAEDGLMATRCKYSKV